MRPTLKKALLLSVACFLGLGGYVFGYFQGYLGGSGHPAMANAVGTVSALNAIREDRKQDAINSLELYLDTEIILSASYEGSYFQLAKLLEGKESDVLVRHVAAYRKKYPSSFPDADVQARIKSGLRIRDQ